MGQILHEAQWYTLSSACQTINRGPESHNWLHCRTLHMKTIGALKNNTGALMTVDDQLDGQLDDQLNNSKITDSLS